MLSYLLPKSLLTSLPSFSPVSSWSVWLIPLKIELPSILGDARRARHGGNCSLFFFFLWLQMFSLIGRSPDSAIPYHSSLLIFIMYQPETVVVFFMYLLVILRRTQGRKQHPKGVRWRECSELTICGAKVRVKDVSTVVQASGTSTDEEPLPSVSVVV